MLISVGASCNNQLLVVPEYIAKRTLVDILTMLVRYVRRQKREEKKRGKIEATSKVCVLLLISNDNSNMHVNAHFKNWSHKKEYIMWSHLQEKKKFFEKKNHCVYVCLCQYDAHMSILLFFSLFFYTTDSGAYTRVIIVSKCRTRERGKGETVISSTVSSILFLDKLNNNNNDDKQYADGQHPRYGWYSIYLSWM